MTLNDETNLSETKTHDAMSYVDDNGMIQIVQKRIGKSTSQMVLNKFKDSFDHQSLQRKNTAVKKPKRTYHIPGKKRFTVKQIFKNSDKISYGFNKIAPFSVGEK